MSEKAYRLDTCTRTRLNTRDTNNLLPRYLSPPYSKILTNPYLGSLQSAQSEKIFAKHAVTHVVTILPENSTAIIPAGDRNNSRLPLLNNESANLLAILPAAI
jgi:hypothetical protein